MLLQHFITYLFLSLVYLKHLSLNTKQTRSECVRTFQIGQNCSRLLSRKINTPRFGLPPSGGLDSTQEPGRNYCGKRGLRREKQSILLTASCGGCIFGTIPSNFSFAFPVPRWAETVFLVGLEGIRCRDAPCRVPPCWLLGNINLPCFPPSAYWGMSGQEIR